MPNSLLTAVSGLLSHQRKLDVVANNLANLNTAGYKAQSVVFSDLIYELLSPASGGNGTTIGGTNPIQVGSGSKTSQIARKFGQGSFDSTGQPLDFALQGEGFFVLSDGSQIYYSRAGAFSLDESGYLIDPSTGYSVLRTGTVGESTSGFPAFQIPGDNRIQIPLGKTILGKATSEVALNGILNADAIGPLAEVLTTANSLLSGGVPATTATLLNDLESNIVDYQSGDVIEITGSNHDGSPLNATLNVNAATTLGDLVSAIDTAVVGASASLDSDGNIQVTADQTGDSLIKVSVSDATGNAGSTDFRGHAFVTTTGGKEGDVFRGVLDIFDVRGGDHELEYQFQKIGDNLWDLTFEMDPSEGTVVDGRIESIQFNDDGTLLSINGLSNPINTVTVRLNGILQEQSFDVSIDNLIQIANDFAMSTEQDGTAPSKLVSVRVDSDGTLQGIASNGIPYDIAQISIALFRNPRGLNAAGDSYFVDSLNSGSAEFGSATNGGRGAIRGGQLEGSNVDVAFEFTQLIVAQRGFSANARTITVADEILEELTNIIR